MSGGYCGIDPPGLSGLTFQLDWAQADIDRQAGLAYERLTRHSRWSVADGVGTQLSGAARWGRLEVDDLRNRIEDIIAAQGVSVFGPTIAGGPWQHYPAAGGFGTTLPGFPFGSPSDYANSADIPWDHIEDWVRGALGVWNGRTDDTFPVGRWVFGNIWMSRVVQRMRGVGPIVNGLRTPTIANGLLIRTLGGSSYFSWINNPAVQLAGKRLSIGLAAYSTISDGIVVWNHGNPIDAFEEHGAGYVADVARLGFSASTTAFLINPNPVFGAAVIITGVIWAGAEVVEHWDEITEFFGDVYGGAEDAVVWAVDETGEIIGEGWDWTTDRWDDFEGWAAETANDVKDWSVDRIEDLNRSLDWADNRLDDAREWTGDRIDDLGDVGGEIIDMGGDLVDGAESIGKKLIPGWG